MSLNVLQIILVVGVYAPQYVLYSSLTHTIQYFSIENRKCDNYY